MSIIFEQAPTVVKCSTQHRQLHSLFIEDVKRSLKQSWPVVPQGQPCAAEGEVNRRLEDLLASKGEHFEWTFETFKKWEIFVISNITM